MSDYSATRSREQALKQLFEQAVGIANQNQNLWVASALELADMLQQGRPMSEILPVKDRLLRDEGFAQCERGFRDHQFDGTEQVSEGFQRAFAKVWQCILDLRLNYEFDYVSIEQGLRGGAGILGVPEKYRETFSEAAKRTGRTRDTIIELTKNRRGRTHTLKQVDTGGVKRAARVDCRQVDRLLQERDTIQGT